MIEQKLLIHTCKKVRYEIRKDKKLECKCDYQPVNLINAGALIVLLCD